MDERVKICSRCGKQLPDNINFCIECGGKAISRISTVPGKTMCHNCGADNKITSAYCMTCGSKLEKEKQPSEIKCSNCSSLNAAKQNFCIECGTPLVKDMTRPAHNNAPKPITRTENKVFNREIHDRHPSYKRVYTETGKPVKKKKKIFLKLAASVMVIYVLFVVVKNILPDNDNGFQTDINSILQSQNTGTGSTGQLTNPEPEAGGIIAEGILSSESYIIESAEEGVKMTIPSYCLDNEAEASIKKVIVKSPIEGVVFNAYDFDITTEEEFDGIIRLEIPYDRTLVPKDKLVEECVGAAYYDEEDLKWVAVDYDIDIDKNVVIINTNHFTPYGSYVDKDGDYKGYGGEGSGSFLSTSMKLVSNNTPKMPDFGVFYTQDQNTTYEKAYRYNVDLLNSGLEKSRKALNEIAAYGMDASSQIKVDFAIKILGDTSSVGGSGATIYNLTSYSGEWSKSLGDTLGNVGGGLVLLQAASDIYHGKTAEETAWNAFKGVLYWKGSAIATHLLGAAAAPYVEVGLVGLFAYELVFGSIDSPIPKWEDYDVHKKAFDAYYEYYHSSPDRKGDSLQGNYRTDKQWKKLIEDINKTALETETLPEGISDRGELFKAMLKREFEDYAGEFWSFDEMALSKKLAATEGAGCFGSYDRTYWLPDRDNHNENCAGEYVKEILNNDYEGLQKEMEEKFIRELVSERLQPMIEAMRFDIMKKRRMEAEKELDDIMNKLNSDIKLEIVDTAKGDNDESAFKGYTIRPKSSYIEKLDDIDQKQWLAVIDESGKASLEFTMLAHQRAGGFSELELYKAGDIPGKDKPERTIAFNISGSVSTIELEEQKLTFISMGAAVENKDTFKSVIKANDEQGNEKEVVFSLQFPSSIRSWTLEEEGSPYGEDYFPHFSLTKNGQQSSYIEAFFMTYDGSFESFKTEVIDKEPASYKKDSLYNNEAYSFHEEQKTNYVRNGTAVHIKELDSLEKTFVLVLFYGGQTLGADDWDEKCRLAEEASDLAVKMVNEAAIRVSR